MFEEEEEEYGEEEGEEEEEEGEEEEGELEGEEEELLVDKFVLKEGETVVGAALRK